MNFNKLQRKVLRPDVRAACRKKWPLKVGFMKFAENVSFIIVMILSKFKNNYITLKDLSIDS